MCSQFLLQPTFQRRHYDVLVGCNLLREGLDLSMVSLVCIMGADNQGFLRSTTSLIQTIGRAARHVNGTVLLYSKTLNYRGVRNCRELL